MSYQRLAYDDADSAARMSADCVACGTQLRITESGPSLDALAATGAAPAIRYADFPHDVRKPEITVSAAAAHLASSLHLHLD